VEYRKILEAHPTLSAAHLGLGDVYIETGARKEAIESYSRALVLRPDQPAAHLKLGIALADENPRAAAQQAKTYMAIEQRPLKDGQRMSVARKIATVSPSGATPLKPPEIAPGPPREVPKVEGMLQEQAAARLREHGFNVGKIDRKESSQNAGTVLDQEPEGGKKAARGTAVDLEVAVPRGSTIEVPDVVGDSRDRAVQKLRGKRLTVAQPITYQASCEEAGKVLRQDPDEDARVPPGTAVALVVASAGAEPVRVPRLVGVRLNDAHRALRERPFKIGRVERRPTSQQPPDTILEQSPRADTLIAPGCPVNVVVAVEPPRVTAPTPQPTPPVPSPNDVVDVPSMLGMTRSDAVATLQKLSLRVTVDYKDVPPPTTRAARVPKHDEVLSQSHSGPVRRGTTIRLTVARVQQPIGE
jgi:beta-lactam-binding protein with PASTA domain